MTAADMARVMGPVIREFTAKAVADATAPLLAKISELEIRLGECAKSDVRIEGYTSFLQRDAAALLERNAALELRIRELETRPPLVGLAGEVGAKGEAGAGIASLVVTAESRLLAHLTDGRSLDAGPVPRGMPGSDGAAGQHGQQGLDGKDGAPGLNGNDGAAGSDGKDGAPGDRGASGEKGLDGLHGRDGRDGAPGLPGMSGEKGLNGKDGIHGRNGSDGLAGKDGAAGLHGKDGLDGLGFDDYDMELDETRGWVFKLARGERVKDWVLGIPFDAKVWAAGAVYPKGAGVTWDGSWWIAQAPTNEQPGEGSTAWRLAVRRGKQGREGKQGKDGKDAVTRTTNTPALYGGQ